MQRFTTVATVVALLAAAGVATGVQQGQEEAPVVEFPITVPDAYKVEGTDAYICVVKALPDAPYKLVGVKPLADESVVHHILLYGARACACGGAQCIPHRPPAELLPQRAHPCA